MEGLIFAGILTIAIIAGVIFLGKKGYIMHREGFQGTTLKDRKQEEEDAKIRASEELKEIQKAELGKLLNIKSKSKKSDD